MRIKLKKFSTRNDGAVLRHYTDEEFELALARERREIIDRGDELIDPEWRSVAATTAQNSRAWVNQRPVGRSSD